MVDMGWAWKSPPAHFHLSSSSFRLHLEHSFIIPMCCLSSYNALLPSLPSPMVSPFKKKKNNSNAAYWRSQLKIHPHPHIPLCVSLLSSYSPSKQKLLTVAQKYSFLCTRFICLGLKNSWEQVPSLSQCCPQRGQQVSVLDKWMLNKSFH